MSVEFGDLRSDSVTREVDAGPEPSSTSVDPMEPEVGTWPEEIGSIASSSFTLRGMGTRPESCGTYQPMDWCEECGEPHFRQSHCETRDCPECYSGNIARRAESATARLSGARHMADSYDEKRLIHGVISAPVGEIRTVQQVYSGFRDAYEIAADHGIRGGAAIFHGFRVKETVKREFREIKELLSALGMCSEAVGHGESMALWDYVRDHRQDWRELTYWSPHYHIIGLCEDFEAFDPESEEWVAWRIRDVEEYRMSASVDGTDAYSDTARLVTYLLGHASHEATAEKDSLRWFGDLSTVKFSMDDVPLSSRRTIEEKAHKAVYGESDEEEDEPRACEMDGCEGELRPIWDAYAALRDRRFTERITTGAEDRLRVAADWMMGDLDPPLSRVEEEARATLDELADQL